MEAPRISVDELRARMDSGEPLIVLDVRQPEAYASSTKKIRGSLYINPNDDAALAAFAQTTDRNAFVVAY